VSKARVLRRLLYAVVLSLGAASALVVTLGTPASASPSKAKGRAASAAASQAVVNSAVPTTGPVPTTCTGPTVNANGTITFCLTAPQATSVQLNFQNMLGLSPAADAFPMTEGSGGLWYITVEPPAGANWYGYNFTVDGAHVADPDNRDIWTGTPGSFSSIGAWSMVMVPGDASQYMANTNVPHGAVATVNYYSTLGQTERRMTVYTPPNYNSHHGYPVLYLMHGAGGNDTDWIVNMRANFILDNLIAQHKVRPMIVVMPDTNVGSTGGLNGSVTADQFIQQELLGTIVPYIEHAYQTLPGARNRALAGLSMGSFHTRNGLFTNPTDFSYYGLFSNGALFPATISDLTQKHPDLIRGVARAERRGVIKEIWISQGDEEPQAIAVLANALQPTLTFFDQSGIKYTYVPGASIGAIYGHVWDTWRKDLVAFAPTLFRESRSHMRRP
jgi:enterochelin esterase-like enzyme